MKKLWALVLGLTLLLGLAGCARTYEEGPDQPVTPPGPADTVPAGPVELEQFLLELRGTREGIFPESLAALEPLGQRLQALLAEEGYVFDTVQITLGASSRSTGDALNAGTVDAALVNTETYIQYAAGLPVLMTSAPDGVDLEVDGGSWTALPAEDHPGWRTVGIFAASSDRGRQLTEESSFEELAQAVWAVPEGGRELDYLSLWLSSRFEGRTLKDLPHVVEMEGTDAMVLAAAAGEVDVLVLTIGDTGGSGLRQLGETTRFYDMLLTVSDAQEPLAEDAFHAALCRCVAALCEEEETMEQLAALGCGHPMVALEETFDPADLEAMLEVMGGTLTWESQA